MPSKPAATAALPARCAVAARPAFASASAPVPGLHMPVSPLHVHNMRALSAGTPECRQRICKQDTTTQGHNRSGEATPVQRRAFAENPALVMARMPPSAPGPAPLPTSEALSASSAAATCAQQGHSASGAAAQQRKTCITLQSPPIMHQTTRIAWTDLKDIVIQHAGIVEERQQYRQQASLRARRRPSQAIPPPHLMLHVQPLCLTGGSPSGLGAWKRETSDRARGNAVRPGRPQQIDRLAAWRQV